MKLPENVSLSEIKQFKKFEEKKEGTEFEVYADEEYQIKRLD